MLTIARGAAVKHLRVVRLAQYLIVYEGELFSGRQLAPTAITGKAGEMKDKIARPSHPVGGTDRAAAPGTLRTEPPGKWEEWLGSGG